jgi:hypothetical protein
MKRTEDVYMEIFTIGSKLLILNVAVRSNEKRPALSEISDPHGHKCEHGYLWIVLPCSMTEFYRRVRGPDGNHSQQAPLKYR